MKPEEKSTPRRIALFGTETDALLPLLETHPELEIIETDPDVVVSYGGDGTLLAAELRWPGIPKVPILNSRLGHRCIHHPADDVIRMLAEGSLVRTEYTKLECGVFFASGKQTEPDAAITCLNEINVDMGRINNAVRFKLWINDGAFDDEVEIIGDGFVACTAFGSTAYFNKITRGIFHQGVGIAFKATSHRITHVVVPEDATVRFLITRGPATLAFDNSTEYVPLQENDVLLVRRHTQSAVMMTCSPVRHLSEPF